jgi:glycerol-3-phosphate acyltransferase PlsY
VGHCYPVWHGFRGGKGAATAVGAIIVIEPWLLIPLLATWLVMLLLSGYVGLATVTAGFSLLPAAWWLNDQYLMMFSVAVAVFLLFTHRDNIRKLKAGTEYRFERIYLFSRKH